MHLTHIDPYWEWYFSIFQPFVNPSNFICLHPSLVTFYNQSGTVSLFSFLSLPPGGSTCRFPYAPARGLVVTKKGWLAKTGCLPEEACFDGVRIEGLGGRDRGRTVGGGLGSTVVRGGQCWVVGLRGEHSMSAHLPQSPGNPPGQVTHALVLFPQNTPRATLVYDNM